MNVKTKKQVNVENQAINLLSKEELSKRIEDVEKERRSYTWREPETNVKFAKNDKLSFITGEHAYGRMRYRQRNPLYKGN